MTAILLALLVASAQLGLPPGAATVEANVHATPVEIVVYSDFQCPFCALFSRPLRTVQSEGVDGAPVAVTFKHFPLPMHRHAPLAHQAAQAAAEQGKFWEMHDLLFANREHVQRADLIAYAQRIGLDLDRFRRDLDSERIKQIVDADRLDAAQLHVNATPTFFVNGRQFSGYVTLDALRRIVAGEARRPHAVDDAIDASMSIGPRAAAVTIELFVDLLSPLSKRAVDLAADLAERYRSEVRVRLRHFPLAFHPQAPLAHEAAIAAASEGRFWEFARALMDHPSAASDTDLVALGVRVGVAASTIADALRDRRFAARVDDEVRSGRERGIRGSPAFVLNGRRFDGLPTRETLTEQIDAALAARTHIDEPRKP